MKALGEIRSLERNDQRLFLIILALAFLVRLCVVPILGLHHPDELWQYLEPAYKLTTGHWVISWPFRNEIRSWLVPVAITPAMWIGHVLDPQGMMHVYLPRAMMAALSLTIVWSAWKLGLRISRAHGLMAAFLAAIWFEFVHLGPRTVAESISTALIFPAVVLLAEEDRRKLFLAGLLLGLAVAVRLQYAPAAAIVAIGFTWGRWRLLPWVIAGGLSGLAIDGLIDFSMGQVPFSWMVRNYHLNLTQLKSSEYGVGPWYQYPFILLYRWNFASGAIIILAALGARRFPLLAAVAVANIVFHSFVPHKEYRFVFLSSAIFIFLAAIGTVDAVQVPGKRRGLLTKAGYAFWLSASAAVAMLPPARGDWVGSNDLLKTLRVAAKTPGTCGFALYQLKHPLSVAYTYYNRDTPILGFKGPDAQAEFHANARRFNLVMTNSIWAWQLGPDYRYQYCTKDHDSFLPYCLYRRPGACVAGPEDDHEINRLIARYDE